MTTMMRRLLATLMLLCIMALAGRALADPAAPPAAPATPAAPPAPTGKDWETVNGAMFDPGETLPASRLVAIAYGFIWVMVAGFVTTVWLRAGKLEGEIADLDRRITLAERRAATGAPRKDAV